MTQTSGQVTANILHVFWKDGRPQWMASIIPGQFLTKAAAIKSFEEFGCKKLPEQDVI